MLTGTYPSFNQAYINDVPLADHILEGKMSIAYEFLKAGYKTGYIGKWHLFGPENLRTEYIPEGVHRLGFNDLWAVTNCSHDYMNNFYYLNDDTTKKYIDGYDVDTYTQLALDFIEEQKDNPFTVFLSYGPPHDPYESVPEEWKDLYNEDSLEFPPNAKPLDNKIFATHAYCRDPHYQKPNKKILRGYYAHISAIDNNVGKIMQKLHDLNLTENTIVVFSSDHGDMLWSQGTMLKNAPWEESVGIPLIIRYPAKIRKGTRTDVLINAPDFMPTLLGLMSMPVPSYVQGNDLSWVITNGTGKRPEAVYIMAAYKWYEYQEWRGVRTERYTYAKTLEGSWVLYDNLNDPYQLNNLAGKEMFSDLENYLSNLTDEFGKKIGDKFEPWSEIQEKLSKRMQEWLKKYEYLV
ncbi:MAG: sulfatase-like hydrolase/transferase [Clostridia bacterium]|nr:sulfatase-like hydrolase/transferase [Clostridia bacterium]